MTRHRITFISLTLTLLATLALSQTMAADSCCPTDSTSGAAATAVAIAAPAAAKDDSDRPAELPPGHPPMPAAGDKQMPPGHPPMPGKAGGSGQMPPGHPPMGKTSGQMPAGHPPMVGGTGGAMGGAMGGAGMPAGHPSTGETGGQPFKGNITIRVVQNTKDGSPLAQLDANVVCYSRSGVSLRKAVKLSDKGTATLEDVEFPEAAQPVVTVTHQGIEYTGVGAIMTAAQPDSAVRVPVYDSTEAEPAWELTMRHVLIDSCDKDMHVTEMLVITNLGDRTWIGTKMLTMPTLDGGKVDVRGTVVLPLPPGAMNVRLVKGFDAMKPRVEDSRIVFTAPLQPGYSKYQLQYDLPLHAGKSTLTMISPAPVKHTMVFVPDDGKPVTVTGLEAGQVMNDGKRATRTYSAANLPAKSEIGLTLTIGDPSKPAAAAPAGNGAPARDPNAPVSSSGKTTKYAVAGGAAALLAVGAVVLMKPAKPR